MIARLLGLRAKREQYLRGATFCREVICRAGVPTLNQAFTAPEALPSLTELHDPGNGFGGSAAGRLMARRVLGAAGLAVLQAVEAAHGGEPVLVACSGGADSLALALAVAGLVRRTGGTARAVVIITVCSPDRRRTACGSVTSSPRSACPPR